MEGYNACKVFCCVPLERFLFTCPIAKPESGENLVTRTSVPIGMYFQHSCSGSNPKCGCFLFNKNGDKWLRNLNRGTGQNKSLASIPIALQSIRLVLPLLLVRFVKVIFGPDIV